MTRKNIRPLKEALDHLGFGEVWNHPNQAARLSGDLPNTFTLEVEADFARNPRMHTTLYFERPSVQENYAFCGFESQLLFSNDVVACRSHLFKAVPGGITHKEAYNLLCGRSVFKSRPGAGDSVETVWIEFNLGVLPQNGRYKIRQYPPGTFDAAVALDRLPVKEKQNTMQRSSIIQSLHEGSPCCVTFVGKGRKERKILEASPRQRCLIIRRLPADATEEELAATLLFPM